LWQTGFSRSTGFMDINEKVNPYILFHHSFLA
jgi:hypothetical protein